MSKRKAYKPKPVHVPMMKESRNALAMQLYAAVKTLADRPDVDACNRVSKILATMSQAGLKSPHLDDASEAVNQITDRFIRVGKIGVSDSEAKTLHRTAGQLDMLLATIPVNVLRASKQMVNTLFRKMQNDAA